MLPTYLFQSFHFILLSLWVLHVFSSLPFIEVLSFCDLYLQSQYLKVFSYFAWFSLVVLAILVSLLRF